MSSEIPEVEEAPLSAEELFEAHKAEINAAFEEKGFFRRMADMLKGLSKPHSSPEFKMARVELQRLAAPILAIVLPVVGVIVLIIVTEVQGQAERKIEVEVARSVEEEAPLEEEQEPEDIEEPPPPEEIVDVQVDVPTVGPVSDMVAPRAAVTTTSGPVSVKPAAQDTVALVKSPIRMKSMAGSRTPGSIGAYTKGGSSYGDATTEAAVLKALRWLKKTQKSSGTWDNGVNQVSIAGLAILTYLAHGETPSDSKEFGETVQRAMQYLVDSLTTRRDKTGQEVPSFKGVDGNEYATLIATYALCEAYGMTRNPNTKIVAMQTLERIVNNQSPTGGWDYGINKESTRDDMSFEGWALQAIKAGKMAGLHPEGLEECIKKAMKCLKTRNFKNGGFNYTAGGNPTGLTATGCLAMQLLGYSNEPEVKAALETMRLWTPSFEGTAGKPLAEALPTGNPQYYCYYASQCKYQAGMCPGATPANVKAWQEWNVAMKQLYPKAMIVPDETIEDANGKPRAIGYWVYNDGTCGGKGAKTMATCLAALQMMVYYRYLPTTKIDGAAAKDDDKSKKKKGKDLDIEVDI